MMTRTITLIVVLVIVDVVISLMILVVEGSSLVAASSSSSPSPMMLVIQESTKQQQRRRQPFTNLPNGNRRRTRTSNNIIQNEHIEDKHTDLQFRLFDSLRNLSIVRKRSPQSNSSLSSESSRSSPPESIPTTPLTMGYVLSIANFGSWKGFGGDSLKRIKSMLHQYQRRIPFPHSSRLSNPKTIGVMVAGTAAMTIAHKIWSSQPIQRATYFWTNAGPIVAHYKFTKWWLTKTNAPLVKRDRVYNRLHNRYCDKSMDIALHLQGLYIKIAQIVSSRPDFIPPVYIDLFVQAQDSLPQWPIEDVKQIIDTTLRTHHNVSIDDVFETIDPIALGSASIGQVHRATFNSKYEETNTNNGYTGGKFAAIKVMHPGAEERFKHDFQVFRWLCKVALTGWEPILDECYRQIMLEFDYQREAESLHTVRQSLANSPFRRQVHVPEPLDTLCTKELLVMEMLDGKKLSDSLEDDLTNALGGDPKVAKEFLRRKRLELILGSDNLNKLGTVDGNDRQIPQSSFDSIGIGSKIKLLQLYWKASKAINLLVNVQGFQILNAGVFNGDPHPGNILLLNDGRLGLIDFGQVKAISNDERLGVANIIRNLNSGSTEDVARSMRQLGFETEKGDDDVMIQYAKLFFDSDAEGKQVYGCPTPQSYFKKLTEADPLTNVPDVAIFVARSSFILRGMGTLLDKQIETSTFWRKYATAALKSSNDQRLDDEDVETTNEDKKPTQQCDQ